MPAKAKIYDICEFIHDVVKPTSLAGFFPSQGQYPEQLSWSAPDATFSSPSELNIPYYNKLRDLLSLVKDIEVVEPERPDECCGFGGMFARRATPYPDRWDVTRVKRHIDTGAEYIVGADGSCLMHQNGIIAREKLPIKTIHIVEVLAAGL